MRFFILNSTCMTDCIFCNIVSREADAQIVYEDEKVIAFLDITPNAPGHTLVIAKEHFANVAEASPEALCHMVKVIKKIAPAVVKGAGAQGYNIGLNDGAVAGQIIFHVHFHIIPRSHHDELVMWQGKGYKDNEEMAYYAEKIRRHISGA